MSIYAKKILITRPEHQADDFAQRLRVLGAVPIFFPVIKIKPVDDLRPFDRALECLSDYDWLVLTSTNAVDIFLERMTSLGILQTPTHLRIAAVGPKTAERLHERGLTTHFVPADYVAEAILPGMGDVCGQRVLLPMADVAQKNLPEAINACGGSAHVITIYHTVQGAPDDTGMRALREGVDILTFTSGSTVRNFLAIVSSANLDPHLLPNTPVIACIGPKTTSVALECGFQVDIVAKDHTMQGLVVAMQAYFKKTEGERPLS